ncbi:centrosomal AT-AC splicing factor-like isoform X2 [Tubulanus polymorphus]|uniref:centrosomal AT-AC splicing factor-like isoform X2 n=1 Tax=Tubulanus polymorphus TaxID=672921 RepID=UPI003DA60E10
MDKSSSNTSFVQFQRCVLCRRNHNQGKKHVYSKHHQETLKRMLRKFEIKVNEALKTLDRPIIEDLCWGNGVKFWCYFCQEEFEVHLKMLTSTVRYGNLLEHLKSSGHVSSTDGFWGANKLHVTEKKIFILSEEEYESFQVAAMKAVQRYETAKYQSLQQDGAKIIETEQHQQSVIHTALHQQVAAAATAASAAEPSCSNGVTSSSSFSLTAAVDDGISTEMRPNIDDYYEQAERNRSKKNDAKTCPRVDKPSFMPMLERVWNKNDGIKRKAFKNQIKRDIKNLKIPELKRTSVKQLAAETGVNLSTHLPIHNRRPYNHLT